MITIKIGTIYKNLALIAKLSIASFLMLSCMEERHIAICDWDCISDGAILESAELVILEGMIKIEGQMITIERHKDQIIVDSISMKSNDIAGCLAIDIDKFHKEYGEIFLERYPHEESTWLSRTHIDRHECNFVSLI